MKKSLFPRTLRNNGGEEFEILDNEFKTLDLTFETFDLTSSSLATSGPSSTTYEPQHQHLALYYYGRRLNIQSDHLPLHPNMLILNAAISELLVNPNKIIPFSLYYPISPDLYVFAPAQVDYDVNNTSEFSTVNLSLLETRQSIEGLLSSQSNEKNARPAKITIVFSLQELNRQLLLPIFYRAMHAVFSKAAGHVTTLKLTYVMDTLSRRYTLEWADYYDSRDKKTSLMNYTKPVIASMLGIPTENLRAHPIGTQPMGNDTDCGRWSQVFIEKIVTRHRDTLETVQSVADDPDAVEFSVVYDERDDLVRATLNTKHLPLPLVLEAPSYATMDLQKVAPAPAVAPRAKGPL